MASNFDFLDKKFPVLAKLGTAAEQCVHSDPRTSVKLQWLLCRSLLNELCAQKTITLPEFPTVSKLVDYLLHVKLVNAEMATCLRRVNEDCFDAKHWLVEPDAMNTLHYTFELCVAFFTVYGNSSHAGALLNEKLCPKKEYYQAEARAQFEKAEQYARADGVLKKSEMAMEYYTSAALGGYAPAQFRTGWFFAAGTRGEAGNYAEAVRYFTMAAAQGYYPAEAHLGTCLVLGKGVPQDFARALILLEPAASKGDKLAEYHLGLMYLQGNGVDVDNEKAAAMFRKSAEQGLPQACYHLARCLEEGKGVQQNADKAAEWYRKAADHGIREAAEALERLGK